MTLHWIEISDDRQISVVGPTIELLREVIRERAVAWVTA